MTLRRTSPAVLALVGVVLASHVLLLAVLEGRERALASNIVQLVAATLAAVACFLTARDSQNFAQRFWQLMGATFGLWAVAQAVWTWYEVYPPADGHTPTDVLFFFAFTPLALSLFLETDPQKMRGLDWQRTLDLVQFGIVLFAAYMYFFYMPARLELGDDAGVTRRLTILFNSRNLFLLGGCALRATLSRSQQVRELFRLAVVIMGVYAVATAGANFARLFLKLGSGNWPDLAWSAPFAFAAVVAATWKQREAEPTLERLSHARKVLSVNLLPTLIPLTVLFLSTRILREQAVLASVLMFFSFACYSLRLAISQHGHEQAVAALRDAEKKFRLLFAANPHPMWVVDLETLRFLEVNNAALRRYGYTREDFLSMRLTQVRAPDEVPHLLEALASETGVREFGMARHRCKDGQLITVEIHAEPLEFAGRPAMLILSQDLTERQRLEEQLRQSQKMEAVGTLAGGIAHDFNNLLTVIKGYSCLVMDRVKDDEQLAREVGQIEKAAEKAASLTRQLLAFSRRQVLQPRVISVNNVVASMDNMLRRTIGEHIEISTQLAADLGTVRADPSQLEQVILNLALNARDAMAAGGKLVFRTRNVVLDEDYAREHLGVRPGRYVVLEVADTGCGMDEETQRHIFEPFFTTKEVGRGTGLGLSTVYGIVKQSEGHIAVDSVVGRGTEFRIYLPRADAAQLDEEANESGTRRAGFETVLLVEDEEVVRSLAQRILESAGYKVLLASRGEEAERICIEYGGVIHLLITDVVMPGMSGQELVARARPKRPGMKVLFISGYTDQAIPQTDLKAGLGFLEKPFSPAGLLRRVREVIEGRSIPSGTAWTSASGSL